jgi:hypothetical protein
MSTGIPDTLLKTNGTAPLIAPGDGKSYTYDELKAILPPQGGGVLVCAHINTPVAPGTVLVINEDADDDDLLNHQASRIAGQPIHGNALLTTNDKVQCLVPPKTPRKLTPAQAEERKRGVAQEIHNLVLDQTRTDIGCDGYRVECFRPGYDRNNSRLEHIMLWEREGCGRSIKGTGPYLAMVTTLGTHLRMVRGDTELKALKALLASVKANPVW